MSNFRAPAVPLITVDPYFNIWSFADRLYDDPSRHWTGRRNAMTGLLKIDGTWRRFLGRVAADNLDYIREPDEIPQTGLELTPLITKYTFACQEVSLTVRFFTPLLMDDLKLLSRPVSYVSYEIRSLDGKTHEVEFYFDISAEAAVNEPSQKVSFTCGEHACSCGRGEKDVLSRSGDNLRIEWGFLHLFSRDHNASLMDDSSKKKMVRRRSPEDLSWMPDGETEVDQCWPCLTLRKTYQVSPLTAAENFLCIGYDDLYSIEYFHCPIRGYWTRDGETFADICGRALQEYEEILSRCEVFDRELLARAAKHGEKYCDIISLAYRQTIGAHKLTWDGEELQFFSKECFSNGCIGTVDVTYPSIPLFLLYNPDLICGMLNPVFRYAAGGDWPFPFAPHDVGQYPLANGQVYGMKSRHRAQGTVVDFQMPVEECGNMILCVAALCRAKGDASYAKKHFNLLQQWVDYLMQKGLDPENQLCTDDFAGHLAHNANLSVKAIMAIASWGMLLGMLGDRTGESRYVEEARRLAVQWQEKAFDADTGCYRLAFDQPGTWSIKYNLVWDRLFGLEIFPREVFHSEVQSYQRRINAYGLPLDSRSDYTKSDWQMWSTVLTDDAAYEKAIIDAMWSMLNDTRDRVPFTDWYYTLSPDMVNFQNRTVQGGLFLNLIYDMVGKKEV